MAKKTTPIITHTEILARAIRSIEDEIDNMKTRCEGRMEEVLVKQICDDYTAERTPKLEALKAMYLIETGNEYC